MGGLGAFFRRWSERAVLRSALHLEEEIHGLYAALDSELAAGPIPEELLRVLKEEREHRELLVNILEGTIPEEEAELVLSEGRFHDLEQVRPLERAASEVLWQSLEHIREREDEVRRFFTGLCGRAKLPAVRRALCRLAEQEGTHVALLDRLLGRTPPQG